MYESVAVSERRNVGTTRLLQRFDASSPGELLAAERVHGKVAGIGWRARFKCAYHRCSRRGSSDRHMLHHLLTRHSTRRRAPESCPFSHIQLEHDQLSEIGLHSSLSNRKVSATMKPDLDGRTVLGLQPGHKAQGAV